MPETNGLTFGAFVVEAAFLGDTAAFALGDGTVRLVDEAGERTVPVHAGAILAATATPDRRLLTGGDDGQVALTDAAGSIAAVAERPRKWIDLVAAGPDGAIAFGSGRQVFVRLKDGRERTFDHERAVGGLAFAPKGLRLAVARYNGVTLWWAGTEAAPVTARVAGRPHRRHLLARRALPGDHHAGERAARLAARRRQGHAHERLHGEAALGVVVGEGALPRHLRRRCGDPVAVPFQGRADGQGAHAARRARGAGHPCRLPSAQRGGGGRLPRRHGAGGALRRRPRRRCCAGPTTARCRRWPGTRAAAGWSSERRPEAPVWSTSPARPY